MDNNIQYKQFGGSSAESNATARAKAQSTFMSGVYQWMALALGLSGLIAWLTANSPVARTFIFRNPIVLIALFIGEIALVWWLSASIRKITVRAAVIAFIAYSALNGVTLSSIFLVYTGASIARVFGITAFMFIAMSFYGMKTRSDLSSMGRYLMMAVIGIIIAGLVNFFLASSALDIALSMITVLVFTGLTAYDSQKLLAAARNADGSESWRKLAIIGALELYLDFINIFLALLRLYGRRN